jgi:HD-GYP domain-containing protein (c-di-GMP phosphodiesterase class II)
MSSGSTKLVFKDEHGTRKTLALNTTVVTLGRARDNVVAFPRNEGVSRYHAEIVPHDGMATVFDRGSSGGTYVNDLPVQEHVLEHGDTVRLGPKPAPELFFYMEDDATELREMPVGATEEAMTVMLPATSLFLNPEKLSKAAAGQDAKSLTLRMKALYELTSQLLSVSDVDGLCKLVLDALFKIMPADRAAVLMRSGDQLGQKAVQVRGGVSAQEAFVPSRTITSKVLTDNVAVMSLDASTDSRFSQGNSVMLQAIRSVICAPLSSAGQTWGVLYLDTTVAKKSFTEDDLELLVAVARQAAMAMENLHLLDEREKTFESMVRALAHSIDARDGITAGHSSRVAKYSQAIARYMGMPPRDCRVIWYAGLLHDYGKIGTREAVLCKPGSLTPEEYEHIKEHPKHTMKILSTINFSKEMEDLPRVASSHHERPDGKGYPNGWKGDETPMGGRIIAVADFFDALTVKRHYREPMPLEEVLALMEKGRDTQFDGTVLDAFTRYFEREYVPFARRLAERKAAAPKANDEVSSHALRPRS